MNSDFVILRADLGSGVRRYWAGRGYWTEKLEEAKVYATRRQVETALNRMASRNSHQAGYLTLEDIKQGY